MSYYPNNQTIYVAVFSAALAGMASAGRVNTDPSPAVYADPSTIAGAFAQQFDTVWGGNLTTDLDVKLAAQETFGFWEGRLGPADTTALDPLTYSETVNALIAMMRAGAAYANAQGIFPIPVGSQIQEIYYRPGAPSIFPYLETWQEIQRVITTALAPFTVFIDKSHLAPSDNATVPASSGDTDCFSLVTIKKSPRDDSTVGLLTYLFIESGARLFDLLGIDGVILASSRVAGGPPSIDFSYQAAFGTSTFRMSNGAALRGGNVGDPPMCEIPVTGGLNVEMGNGCQIFGGPTAGSGHAEVFSLGGFGTAGLFLNTSGSCTVTSGSITSVDGSSTVRLTYDQKYLSDADTAGEPTFPVFPGFAGTYITVGPQLNIAGAGTPVVGPAAYDAHSAEIVFVDCSAGNVDINLPQFASGGQVIIKAVALSGNTITVHPFGAGTIDGAPTDVIAPAVTLQSRIYSQGGRGNVNWFVTSQYG